MFISTYRRILDLKQYLYHEGFKKYFHNTGWIFSGKIFSLIISFFVIAYVARYLGPTNYGLLSYAISFVGLFSFIANLGIDQVVYREIIRYPEKRNEYLGTSFFIKIFSGSLAFLSVLTIILILKQENLINILLLIIAFSFIFQSFNVINGFFGSQLLSKYTTIASICVIFLLSTTKILLVLFNRGIIYFAAVYLLESVLYALSFLIIYKLFKQNIFSWRFDKKLAKQILLDSWPLLFVSVFALIYTRFDQIMVKYMINQTAVGFYDVAVRVAEVWYFIPGLITASLIPAIVNAKKINEVVYKKRLKDLLLLIFIISIAISLPIFLLAKPIINIFFGPAYLPAISVLQIYVWAGIGLAMAEAANQYLITENFTKILFVSSCVGMILNLILNFVFIPIYGINGAAFSTLISYFSIPLLIILLLKIKSWKNA
ncbi:MAG: flippase [Candidatus Margulisiibacteriota bacterium]|jgi:O-antigen/teichoic acid export membrane protein